jgi:hypothetical protein
MNDDSHFYLSKQINNVDLAEIHTQKEVMLEKTILAYFFQIYKNTTKLLTKNLQKRKKTGS